MPPCLPPAQLPALSQAVPQRFAGDDVRSTDILAPRPPPTPTQKNPNIHARAAAASVILCTAVDGDDVLLNAVFDGSYSSQNLLNWKCTSKDPFPPSALLLRPATPSAPPRLSARRCGYIHMLSRCRVLLCFDDAVRRPCRPCPICSIAWGRVVCRASRGWPIWLGRRARHLCRWAICRCALVRRVRNFDLQQLFSIPR